MEIAIKIFGCILQILLFQFVATPFFRKLTYGLSINRNFDWIKKNSNFLLDNPIPNCMSHYVFGVIFVLMALFYPLIISYYDYIWLIHIFSATLMMIQYFAIDYKLFIKMRKSIPKLSRIASISPRKLSDFIKIKTILLLLILALINLLLWGGHYLSIEMNIKEISKIILHLFAFGVLIGAIKITIERSPISDNLVLDNEFRKLEMFSVSSVLFFFLLNGLFSYFSKLVYPNNELLHILNSTHGIFPLMCFAYFLFLSKTIPKKLSDF